MNVNRFLFLLLGLLLAHPASAQSDPRPADTGDRVIRLDLQNEQGPLDTFFQRSVGAGRANEGLRADWQRQLAMVQDEAGFEYIRMHGLLSDDMGIYKIDASGQPLYNFQYVDVLYDYILSIGMKPFVELSFMPSALASGDQTIFWWRGNVTPPWDYGKWEELIYNLVAHFTERYGEEEVATWYFEVWNEPNLQDGFWTGTRAEYFKLYEHSARAVKRVNPAYRVGGPATAGSAWVPEMIAYCEEHDVPLDFISTHEYGVEQGFLDEHGNTGTVLSDDPQSISRTVLESKEQILASSMPELELHYTEWSSSYTPADPIHDSYHQAAYILDRLKKTRGAAESMSYWTFTDIFEEAGPRFTPFHGGFGLVNYQGIKKPSFFAYALLGELGATELASSDSSSWATKDLSGGVQVLFWDYTYTLPADSTNNQDYYVRDLPPEPQGSTTVEIRNVAPGPYRLDVYQVGYEVNDPYTTYLKLGRPRQLSREQVAFIKEQNDGAPITTELVTVDDSGVFTRTLRQRANDVFLVQLTRL